MGLLIDGKWHDRWYNTKDSGGRFVRQDSAFRHWVRADGSTAFKPEANRYHLYVSLACPWAHRTLIMRRLKGLQHVIGVSVVHPVMLEHGWTFDAVAGDSGGDSVNNYTYLYDVYVAAQPNYSGRVTVPVLWDKHAKTIVNNESSEIIRMFNAEFDELGDNHHDYYPPALRPEIDSVNEFVYHDINNGVYRCGFATTQDAYDEAYLALFAALDNIEARLAAQRYLAGPVITEADWRLFTTLVRFDTVYYSHFKCNRQRLRDYHQLWNYTRELYQHRHIAETVNMHHIKTHYFASHRSINPSGIVPQGPVIDFAAPHDRGH